MKVVGMKGRLLIAPIGAEPYEVPEDKSGETWFCTRIHDGELYYYTGKDQSSASSSFHAIMVTVLDAHIEEYEI